MIEKLEQCPLCRADRFPPFNYDAQRCDCGWPATSPGAGLIVEERIRQIEVEGWTADHDDATHRRGDLALAAICYAAAEPVFTAHSRRGGTLFRDPWPFGDQWDKRPWDETRGEVMHPADWPAEVRIDLLVKAGALIAAEIDRELRRFLTPAEIDWMRRLNAIADPDTTSIDTPPEVDVDKLMAAGFIKQYELGAPDYYVTGDGRDRLEEEGAAPDGAS